MTILVGILNKCGAVLAADSAATYTSYSREIDFYDKERDKQITDIIQLIKANSVESDEIILQEIERDIYYIGEGGNEKMMDTIISDINAVCKKEETKQEIIKRIKEIGKIEKKTNRVINNGNKLMRLTDSHEFPISVMATGFSKINNFYWNDVVRFYRKKNVNHSILYMENCIDDFMAFATKFYNEVNNSQVRFEKTDRKKEDDDVSHLIFCGYEKDNDYPSLFNVTIYNQINNKYDYYIEKFIVNDENPSIIKYYGMPDAIESLLTGVNPEYLYQGYNDSLIYRMFKGNKKIIKDRKDDINCLRYWCTDKKDENLGKWKKQIEHFELSEMAEYAEMLIELTELYHTLRFFPIYAGGPVDVAVITKKRGFEWIQCKDYYTYAPKRVKKNNLNPLNR